MLTVGATEPRREVVGGKTEHCGGSYDENGASSLTCCHWMSRTPSPSTTKRSAVFPVAMRERKEGDGKSKDLTEDAGDMRRRRDRKINGRK